MSTGSRQSDRVTEVLGRPPRAEGATAHLGAHRAPDGSAGEPLHVDLDRPHAGLVVGKRGYGKSYTLGVLAEELARADGVAPVVVDPMGVFSGLAEAADGTPVPATVVDDPAVSAGSVPPPAWCEMLGLSPESGVGALVWQAAAAADTLDGMCTHVEGAEADRATRRGARNHLRLAETWDVFDPRGMPAEVTDGAATVVDLSRVETAPANAVVRGLALQLYRGRVSGSIERLPWLLVDEAHVLFEGVAGEGLRTLLTRGRQPGVSLVVATQRPASLPGVVASQADLTIAHRLTARPDREALARGRPAYVEGTLLDRGPARPGEATLVDDVTESVHTVGVRERATPHGGASPRASEVGSDGDHRT